MTKRPNPLQLPYSSFAVLSLLLPMIAASQQLVAGKVNVTSQGDLQYTIPIIVPTGVGGVQPELSLSYDSSAGPGNLGGGWSLNGLPQITRCPRTVAVDGVRRGVNFTSDDGLCLEGERLIAVNGVYGEAETEYRTERDTFAKIVQKGTWTNNYVWDGLNSTWQSKNGGADSFLVFSKSGRTMTFSRYGSNGAYGVDQAGLGVAAKSWVLTKVKDAAGNTMKIYYSQSTNANATLQEKGEWPVDDGALYPTQIAYNYNEGVGGSELKVNFYWDPITASVPLQFTAGSPRNRSGHLSYISTTPVLYTYRFSRETPSSGSGLAMDDLPWRVTEFNACGPSGVCLPTTTFMYEPTGDRAHPLQTALTSNAFPGLQKDYKQYFIDINGDGKKWWMQISQAADDAWIGALGLEGKFTAANWTKLSVPIGALNDYEHYFADVDGDGKADWIRISRLGNLGWVALGLGNGQFQAWAQINQPVASEASYGHFFADLNGDGKADMIEISRGGDKTSIAMAGTGGNFLAWTKPAQQIGLATRRTQFADVNGDGMMDWIATAGDSVVYISRGDGTFGTAAKGSSGHSVLGNCIFGDINGDMNQDPICMHPDGVNILSYVSQGDGSFTPPLNIATYGPIQLADINGDGMADRLTDFQTSVATEYTPARGDNGYYLSRFNNIPSPLPGGTASTDGYDRYYVDLNGDGRADFILVNRTTKAASVLINALGNPYLITGISDPKYGKVNIEYKLQSDSSVYTPDTDAVWPLRDAAYPLLDSTRPPYLVSSVSRPNGVGGTSNTTYTYGGQKTDLSRQAVLGFRWMKSTEVESGISTYTQFRQDWPFAGLPIKTTTSLGGDQVLKQAENTYSCTDFVSVTGCTVAPKRRYFPYLSRTTVASWDLNRMALPSTTVTREVDAFGNPTRTLTSSSDGYSTTVDTVYTNDAVKWWIGRPVRTTVTKTTP